MARRSHRKPVKASACLATRRLSEDIAIEDRLLNLVGWRIVDGQPQVRSMMIDKPWTAVATGDVDSLDEDYHWSPDGWHTSGSIKRDDFEERRDWFQESVRFAMLLGALLEAENTFLRTRDEARRRSAVRPQSQESHVRPVGSLATLALTQNRASAASPRRLLLLKARATARHRRTVLGRGHSPRARPPPALRRRKPTAPLGHHQSPHFSPLGVSKAEASRCWE